MLRREGFVSRSGNEVESSEVPQTPVDQESHEKEENVSDTKPKKRKTSNELLDESKFNHRPNNAFTTYKEIRKRREQERADRLRLVM